MAQQTVTLTSAEKKSGSNSKGGWFFHVFKDAGGNSWQTGFGDALGDKLANSLNQPVTLTYHEESRTKDGKTFTNNVIDGAGFGGISEQQANALLAISQASDKDTSIARAVAFKGAIELAANGVLDADPDGIIQVADHFTGWLLSGQVAETADTRL